MLLTCSVAPNTNIFTMDTVMTGSVLTVHQPGLISITGYIIQKDWTSSLAIECRATDNSIWKISEHAIKSMRLTTFNASQNYVSVYEIWYVKIDAFSLDILSDLSFWGAILVKMWPQVQMKVKKGCFFFFFFFLHADCWKKKSSMITQMYTFVGTHYWGKCTLVLSPHGQSCINLYTLGWERGVQICILMPVFTIKLLLTV